jgi:hypothetical protein
VPGASIAGMTHAAILMLRNQPRSPGQGHAKSHAQTDADRSRRDTRRGAPSAGGGVRERPAGALEERVRGLLAEHGALTGVEIAQRLGIAPSYARKLRARIGERSPRGARRRPAPLPSPSGVRLIEAGDGAGPEERAGEEVSA